MIAAQHLLLMACSATKLDRPSPALELYRGVMYETYRVHVKPAARPHVVILSALHGFIHPEVMVSPYEMKMTTGRADEMLSDLSLYMDGVAWPAEVQHVFLAGGAHYRRVMSAAVDRLIQMGVIAPAAVVDATAGGIGFQRSQLGRYLDNLAPLAKSMQRS